MQNADDDQMIARGLTLYGKACMTGCTECCWYAARNIDDDAKARKYLEFACNKRHVRSCFELARRVGAAGDDKSKKEATVIYKKLISILEPRCDAKEVYACNKLGEVYDLLATECRKRACQAGVGEPCE